MKPAYGTAVFIAELAKSQVGIKESIGPNNGVPFKKYALPGEQPLAWCARFVRWCWYMGAVKMPGNQYEIAAVQKMEDEFKKAGRFTDKPGIGYVVFYKSRAGSDKGPGRHCGLVVKIEGEKLWTVEGNFGDQVAQRSCTLPNDQISGYGALPKE